jgi:hypothetical protein
MALIANIRHFLDENGDVHNLAPEAQELLSFLAKIIDTATINYGSPLSLCDVNCRIVSNGQSCPGEIGVWVYEENNHIGWECLHCKDEGVIIDWEKTPWDNRSYTHH